MGHLHGAPAWFVPPSTILTFGTAAVALSAAAFFSLSTPAPLLTLLFISASTPALPLPGAWTSAPAFPFPEICHSTYWSKGVYRQIDTRTNRKKKNILLVLVIVSICMRGLCLILSKVDTRTSWGRRWNISSRQRVGGWRGGRQDKRKYKIYLINNDTSNFFS